MDPSRRPASARALSEAIERFLDGDRDVTLRRETAAKHAEIASAAARAALGADDLAARRRASAEAARALAFDPENRSALEVLLEMLTRPPRTVPPEARASLERADAERTRELARQGVITTATYIPLLALALFYPVLDRWVVALLSLTVITAIALMWAASRADRSDTPLVAVSLAFLLATTMLATRVAGPFMLAPGFLMAIVIGFGLFPGRRRRIAYFVASVLALPLVFVIDRSGLVPPTCVFTADALRVIPRVLAFDGRSLAALLMVATVMPIVASCTVVNRMLERAANNETAMEVTAWQLRQMLPERTGPSAAD
jgi:serine/threonine-protein kinase